MISSHSPESLIIQFFTGVCKDIIMDRNAKLNWMSSSPQKYKDHIHYIEQSLNKFRVDFSRPLVIDLHLQLPNKSLLHIEKWVVHYQQVPDSREVRPPAIFSRRVRTLMRTVHSFVRLLPGFNRLHANSAQQHTISFQLHVQKDANPFPNEATRYVFPQVPISKGFLSVSVQYLGPAAVEEALRQFNDGRYGAGLESHTASSSSAAIPIPSRSRRDSGSQRGEARNRSIEQFVGQLYGMQRRPSLSDRPTPIKTIADHFGSPLPAVDPSHVHARSLPTDPIPFPSPRDPFSYPPHPVSMGANNISPSQMFTMMHGGAQPRYFESSSLPKGPQSLSWTSTPPFVISNSLGQNNSPHDQPSSFPKMSPPFDPPSTTLFSTSPHVSNLAQIFGQSPNALASPLLMWSKQPHPLQPHKKALVPINASSFSGANTFSATLQSGSQAGSFKHGSITSEHGPDPGEREVVFLHEFEELKMRLVFPLAAFVPIHFLSEHFPSVSTSGIVIAAESASSSSHVSGPGPYIKTTEGALSAAALRLVATDPNAARSAGIDVDSDEIQLFVRKNQLDAVLQAESGRAFERDRFFSENSRDEERKPSEDFGAAGMMDEDMPFAFIPGDTSAHVVAPSTPGSKRRNSLTATLDGSMLTAFAPSLSDELSRKIDDFRAFAASIKESAR